VPAEALGRCVQGAVDARERKQRMIGGERASRGVDEHRGDVEADFVEDLQRERVERRRRHRGGGGGGGGGGEG
jgi:hypothetical protein